MHYTALLGTVYYPGNSETGPPKPVLRTPALIGTIAAIVVVACLILCFFVAKTGIENTHLSFRKKSYAKRLILDCVLFDTNGRILVKVDGSVPMKEVLQKLPEEACCLFNVYNLRLTVFNRTNMVRFPSTTHFSFDFLKHLFSGQI